jgi:hypothetical protein
LKLPLLPASLHAARLISARASDAVLFDVLNVDLLEWLS